MNYNKLYGKKGLPISLQQVPPAFSRFYIRTKCSIHVILSCKKIFTCSLNINKNDEYKIVKIGPLFFTSSLLFYC